MAFTSTIGAGFGENRAVFMQPLFKDWTIYPVALLFCYTVAFFTFFTAVTVIIFSDLKEFGLRNISFKLFFLRLAFCFCLRMIGEILRTSPRRPPLTLDGSEFDNFGGGDNFMRTVVGVSSRETWVGFDGWTGAGAKACHFSGIFNRQHCHIKYIFVDR